MNRPLLGAVALIALGTSRMLWASNEPTFLTNTRQLIFEGARSGEGYFDTGARRLIFQSEREPGNPFYQMYVLDLETGDSTRVSPGIGKTSCGWIHPFEERVLFASTHEDPGALAKQSQELAERASGQTRRYAWSFDEHYDIYQSTLPAGKLENLTNVPGYDAEGSWSPDGSQIAFASNRHAYTDTLTQEEQARLAEDASFFMDIYIMNSDGSNVRRLTRSPGYDGGPFFSPDGTRLTWRRFSPDGHQAEIFTMRTDGSDMRQLTRLGVMSWAPFYHPSGDYIVFTNNLQGYRNFELYIVDAEGQSEPVRVTYSDGFDGLPVFSPDGTRLAWASGRTPDRKSQIFMAGWDDATARELLTLPLEAVTADPDDAPPDAASTKPGITVADLRQHVEYLASEELEGRQSGTRGARLAADYIARVFEAAGLEPAGDDGGYFQPFDFTAGVRLGKGNSLESSGLEGLDIDVDRDWRPLALSRDGPVASTRIVFAGYGIVAPGTSEYRPYDAYGEVDVTDRWVMVLRYAPEQLEPDHRLHLSQYASLNYKAKLARDRGARGLIVVTGPSAQVNDSLVELTFDTAVGGTSIAAISVTDELADTMLAGAGRRLTDLTTALDTGETPAGFELAEVELAATVSLEREVRTARNVVARLRGQSSETELVIGAHFDHLGRGATSDSRADRDERGQVHYGADDNASGVAALLEIAQHLSHEAVRQSFRPERDIVFATWSGEEIGTLGSDHFVKSRAAEIATSTAAYLNMDMVGRLDRTLYLQGVGSSSVWRSEIEKRNVVVGLPVTIQLDSYLPTDSTPFYLAGVPVLSAFTGAHADYNTPRDAASAINYEGLKRISSLMNLILRGLANQTQAPDYIAMEKPAGSPTRQNLRAYLGTIPEYGESDTLGVMLNGVTEGGPAAQAGLRRGDVIVELGGQKVENIYDYTYALNAAKVGDDMAVVVLRAGERLTLQVKPSSRD